MCHFAPALSNKVTTSHQISLQSQFSAIFPYTVPLVHFYHFYSFSRTLKPNPISTDSQDLTLLPQDEYAWEWSLLCVQNNMPWIYSQINIHISSILGLDNLLHQLLLWLSFDLCLSGIWSYYRFFFFSLCATSINLWHFLLILNLLNLKVFFQLLICKFFCWNTLFPPLIYPVSRVNYFLLSCVFNAILSI